METRERTGADVVAEIRAKREAREGPIKAAAKLAWDKMDKNQKHGIRFGLFPFEVMEANKYGNRDDDRVFTCALMDCAQADGGMRA